MQFPKTKQNRKQLSFKKGEVERYARMEQELKDKLGICTFSDVYKYALKKTYSIHTDKDLVLI